MDLKELLITFAILSIVVLLAYNPGPLDLWTSGPKKPTELKGDRLSVLRPGHCPGTGW